MLLVREQGTEAWKAAHLGRITSSTAAACLGLDRYNSAKWAWRSILGTEPFRDNPFMRWGIAQEAAARNAYEAHSGTFVDETGFWVHPEFPWLGASPDGLIGQDGLLEIKCPVSGLPDKVPVDHRIQCLIQLAVTGRAWCDYWAWTPEGTFLRRVYPAGIEGLIARLERFRREYVLTNLEPPRKKPRRKKCKTDKPSLVAESPLPTAKESSTPSCPNLG